MLLLLCLFVLPCQQLDSLQETLSAATDKASYEKGAYSAAKELADIHTPEAMHLRLKLFDRKWDTYRGVYLREWFYSGYLKARSQEETALMVAAASSQRQSDWHRILLLRALSRCRGTVSGKMMLQKSFHRAPASVQRAWSEALGVLLSEQRIDFSDLPPTKTKTPEDLLRTQLQAAGYADGFLALPTLTPKEITFLQRLAIHAKEAGDRAIAVRALAAHPHAWSALTIVAPAVFSARSCGPRTAFLESAVEHHIYAMTPLLIEALQDEAKHIPNRFSGDLGSALRALTGQGFGDSPGLWAQWYQESGKAWLQKTKTESAVAFPNFTQQDHGTVARFFGLAVESAHVAVLVDGSGSMRSSKLGSLSCAKAAAREAGKFLAQLPKDARFQVIVMETTPILGFQQLVPATKANRIKAVQFLESRDYQHASALYDALETASLDPLVDTIILVSDGGSSAGKHQYSGHLLDSAQRLHLRTGVRIQSILVTDSTKHESFMRELAESTGGKMVRPK